MKRTGSFIFARMTDLILIGQSNISMNQSFWQIKEGVEWLTRREAPIFKTLMDGYFSVVAEVQKLENI